MEMVLSCCNNMAIGEDCGFGECLNVGWWVGTHCIRIMSIKRSITERRLGTDS